jgi:hypothetical protein
MTTKKIRLILCIEKKTIKIFNGNNGCDIFQVQVNINHNHYMKDGNSLFLRLK